MAITLQSSETTPETTFKFPSRRKKTIRNWVDHFITIDGDHYKAIRERYPLFNKPDTFFSELKTDPLLFLALVEKFDSFILFKAARIAFYFRIDGELKKNVHIPTNSRMKAYELEDGNQFTLDTFHDHLMGYCASGLKFRHNNDIVPVKERTKTPTMFIVIDVDITNDIERCEKVTLLLYETAKKYMTPHVSFSGSKGFHLEFYPTVPIFSKDVALFRDMIIEESGVKALLTEGESKNLERGLTIENFPKRTGGNGCKLQLSVHPATGMFCGYLKIENNQLIPLSTSYNYFLNIPKEDPTCLLKAVHLYRKQKEQAELFVNAKKAKAQQTKGKELKKGKDPINADKFGVYDAHIHEIKKEGLIVCESGNRHNTTYAYMQHLKNNNYTNEEIIEIITTWSHEVLYEKCGNKILTSIEEHLDWVKASVEYLVVNNRPMAYCHSLSKEEFLSFLPFLQTEKGIEMKKAKVLFGLYLFAIIKNQLQQELQEKTKYAEQVEEGFLIKASSRYLVKILSMGDKTISKQLKELKEMGCITIVNRGHGGVKGKDEHLWESAQYFLPTHFVESKNANGADNTFDVTLMGLKDRNLIHLLFATFLNKQELAELFGKRSHHYRTILSVQNNL